MITESVVRSNMPVSVETPLVGTEPVPVHPVHTYLVVPFVIGIFDMDADIAP